MLASTVVYAGLTIAIAGLALFAKPIRRLRVPTRRRAAAIAGAGALMVGSALILPAPESRVSRVETRLDEFAPVWQFREVHTIRIAASPARAFEAIKRVRPDEVFLFGTLIWIRRGGQPFPKSVLDDTRRFESLIDVATHSTFVYLADDAPREFVVGTVVGRPRDAREPITPEMFRQRLPPGFALAVMNFLVTSDGGRGSIVSTETRVFANSPSARRRFAAYWRVIYPGSAIIRRMWLRAIERRATGPEGREAGSRPSTTPSADYRASPGSVASRALARNCRPARRCWTDPRRPCYGRRANVGTLARAAAQRLVSGLDAAQPRVSRNGRSIETKEAS